MGKNKAALPPVNALCLFLCALIWGVAFVAQSVGMGYVGGFTFNAARSFLGCAVLLPVIFLTDRKKDAKKAVRPENKEGRRTLITGGIACGLCLFAASSFQQFGIKYTTVGKAGFITALYIIIVPILGIFLKKRCSPLIWISVALAVAGLYLLCISGSLQIGKGDLLVLICAFLFSLHILVIDYYSPKADGLKLSCIQFLTAGICSLIPALILEKPDPAALHGALLPILYAGVLSSGAGYTLQIVGQKGADPTLASLILSLESCISVIAGWLLLGQRMGAREICGCALMFGAIILAQLPLEQIPHLLKRKTNYG